MTAAVSFFAGGFYAFSQGLSQNYYTPPASQYMPQALPQNNSFVLSATSNSSLGTYLIAENGMTLYKYANDAPGMSNCTGQCAMVWPPYAISSSDPLMGNVGVARTIAKITRSDGTMQVTYNGSPLYFFSQDKLPGDANGQNFAGLWSIVNP